MFLNFSDFLPLNFLVIFFFNFNFSCHFLSFKFLSVFDIFFKFFFVGIFSFNCPDLFLFNFFFLSIFGYFYSFFVAKFNFRSFLEFSVPYFPVIFCLVVIFLISQRILFKYFCHFFSFEFYSLCFPYFFFLCVFLPFFVQFLSFYQLSFS